MLGTDHPEAESVSNASTRSMFESANVRVAVIVAIGGVAGKRVTDADNLVVGVSDNTECRHTRPQARNCSERTNSSLL
jgi:uracil-DNA glycosylase